MRAASRAVPRAAQPTTWSGRSPRTTVTPSRGEGAGGWAVRAAAVLAGLTLLAAPARALEYRSVAEAGAVMFDAPSQKARPLFIIVRDTPVEVVVGLEGWVKVRDAAGDLAWVEKKSLAEKRMLIVTAQRAEVRAQAEAGAPLVFEADKDVLLEFVEAGPPGWAKVRHRDGQSGFVRANQVWGL
jgi:SH3-like domain-containing protein